MKHPLRWILGGVALVVAVIVGLGAWYVLADNAPARPKLDTSGTAETGGPATPDGFWSVEQGKTVYVGYRMTEVFRGDIIHKSAVGRTPAVVGTMNIAGREVTDASVTADLRELASDRSPRDNYIHTHGIESDRYPEATFALTTPITLPQPMQKGQPVHVMATGTLTLHGVTRTITLPLDAVWKGPTIEVVGTTPVQLRDYEIDPPETSVVKADDHGSLELALTFVPA